MEQATISHPNMIAGMRDMGVEFYAVEGNEVECMHNRQTLCFEQFPAFVKAIIANDMLQNPSLVSALKMADCDETETMKAYITTYFGRLDNVADIDTNGNIRREEKHPFSYAELRVLTLGHLPDKLIADRLCLAKSTVDGHWQNMRAKTGLKNKVELAIMAVKNDLI